jgi:uncharacterized DUF497 family protein
VPFPKLRPYVIGNKQVSKREALSTQRSEFSKGNSSVWFSHHLDVACRGQARATYMRFAHKVRVLPKNTLAMTSRSQMFGVQLCTVTTFEWDLRKAASNVRKHGIYFTDAVLVLEDDRAITFREDAPDEERWVTIGMDAFARILVLVYTWRGNSIRIISARPATPAENSHYMESI